MSSFAATSIPNTEQLSYLVSLGFKEINLHLVDDELSPQIIKKMIYDSKCKVLSVHTPYSSCNKGFLERIGNSDSIAYACSIADMVSNGDKIIVVCHTQLGTITESAPELLTSIIRELDELLTIYPNITIAVENNMIFNSYIKNISQASLPSYTNTVREIRKRCKYPDRIGTVLDTCHAQSTIYTIDSMFTDWVLTMEDYFKANVDLCKVIHFSNSIGHGMKKSEHGIGFDKNNPNDVRRMEHYFDLYNKYTPNALLVYEICEDDYSSRINFRKTINTMRYINLKNANKTA